MALIDGWQEQRRQRQQELRSRQEKVSSDLDQWHQNRQNMALEQRHNLEQYRQRLNTDTEKFLTSRRDRRYEQSQQQARELDEFAEALAAQTAEFLSSTARSRQLMADELKTDLEEFHSHLVTSVAQMCTELQQQRQDMEWQQRQDLASFMEALRDDVAGYLQELHLLGEQRELRLCQTIEENRQLRSATMEALYSRLAEFREQLRQYAIDVQIEVWGAPRPQPVVASALTQKPRPRSIQATRPSTQSQQPKPSRPPAIARPSVTIPLPSQLSRAASAKKQEPEISDTESIPYEEEIYDYIQQAQSVRLKEIEEALGINRIQAVDALRSLMTEGLITQRDRAYVPVEEESG